MLVVPYIMDSKQTIKELTEGGRHDDHSKINKK